MQVRHRVNAKATFASADEEESFRSNVAVLEVHHRTSVSWARQWGLAQRGGHFMD